MMQSCRKKVEHSLIGNMTLGVGGELHGALTLPGFFFPLRNLHFINCALALGSAVNGCFEIKEYKLQPLPCITTGFSAIKPAGNCVLSLWVDVKAQT